MIKTIISGASGKMGGRIIAVSKDYPELQVSAALEKTGHATLGSDAGAIAGISPIGVMISDDVEGALQKGDVLIEFTAVASTLEHVAAAVRAGKAMVIGTTGLQKDDLLKIGVWAKEIPIVLAPNMSVGVNLLLRVLKDIATVTGDDYDVEIVEAHHRLKKDAPSGTALKMAQVIADQLNRNLDEVGVYARKGIIGERTKKEIGIQTIRAGDIVGEHTVIFAIPGERIEITHKASSRDTFARGACKAALWVANRKAGLYDMQDVLGLK